MGLFDYFLSPSKRCEKVVYKQLDDVAKAAKLGASETLNDSKEDEKLQTAMIMTLMMSAIQALKQDRNLQMRFNLSESEYEEIVLKVSYRINRKYIPNWDNHIRDALIRKIKPKSQFKLLYFYGTPNDDLATTLFGKSLANKLVSEQDERFRIDPPSIPVERVSVGERTDLVEKYNVRSFPSFYLIDEKEQVINVWKGELTGTDIDNYIKNIK